MLYSILLNSTLYAFNSHLTIRNYKILYTTNSILYAGMLLIIYKVNGMYNISNKSEGN